MGAWCTKLCFGSGSAAETTDYQAVGGSGQPADVAMKEMAAGQLTDEDDEQLDADFHDWEASEAEADKADDARTDTLTSIAVGTTIAPLPTNPAPSPVVPKLEKPPAAATVAGTGGSSSYAAAVALAQQSQESLFGDMAVSSYVEAPRIAPKAKPQQAASAASASAANAPTPVRATGKFDAEHLIDDSATSNPYDADLGLDLAELGIDVQDHEEQAPPAAKATTPAATVSTAKKQTGGNVGKDKKQKGLGAVAVAVAASPDSDDADDDLDSMLADIGV